MVTAWSVDKSQTVPSDRNGAQAIAATYLNNGSAYFALFHTTVTAQSLSLIDYSTKDINAVGNPPTPTTPVLQVDLLVYVWSYGLQSWTSKLGVVIVIMGCLIVLIKVVVAAWTHTLCRDVLDYVTTALQQKLPGIFKGLDAKDVGRVRFRMENEEAKFKFNHKDK